MNAQANKHLIVPFIFFIVFYHRFVRLRTYYVYLRTSKIRNLIYFSTMKKEAQVYITQKITILIFCSFVPLLVLGNNTKVHNFNRQHLTIESGLPHTDANATIQDKNGITWIGTYSGLCKYDGHLIETFHQSQEGLNNTYTNRILDIS